MKEAKIYKTCKGWKVLSLGRNSISGSLYWDNPLSINYPPNETIYPQKGKLFFFKYKKDAERFYRRFEPCLLVKCVATNYTKAVKMIAVFPKEFDIYWSDGSDMLDVKNPPDGTYFADSIKCLE